MDISVFGLGYVGCVTSACLADDGHNIIGVDINPYKVDQVINAKSPIIEPGLDEIIRENVKNGRLTATTHIDHAINNSTVSLICVGTPSRSNGSINTQYIENVSAEIGSALANKSEYHVVVIRSTVLPGLIQDCVIPILENSSNKNAGIDFGLCVNPEFLREGSALKDYYNPGFVMIGSIDKRSGDIVESLYQAIEAPLVRTNIDTAEIVKYVSNAFHALKITFANEIGNICKAHGIDGQEVMEIICLDEQLNISPAYLKSGFAFGGSCLPKDLRALLHRANQLEQDSQLLSAILPSNQLQIERGAALIKKSGFKKVGILGLSFKAGTDDVRESPIITMVESLVKDDYEIKIYDENLIINGLIGSNKNFLEQEHPDIIDLMSPSLKDVINKSDVIVITNGSETYQQVHHLIDNNQILIDLVGIAKNHPYSEGKYHGICW